MVEVFQTNVLKMKQAKQLAQQLKQGCPGSKINFDLTDCDKILRIESQNINPEMIIDCLEKNGFECKILD
jgi:tRNA G26 N,N-dimethylase Trm1